MRGKTYLFADGLFTEEESLAESVLLLRHLPHLPLALKNKRKLEMTTDGCKPLLAPLAFLEEHSSVSGMVSKSPYGELKFIHTNQSNFNAMFQLPIGEQIRLICFQNKGSQV